jgi:hypothetical protein
MVSRRPARASRSSRTSTGSGVGTGRSSRSWGAKDGTGGATSSSAIRRSDTPASKWISIRRPPSAGIGFVVETWVRLDQLTRAERLKYLPESIVEDDAVMQEASGDGHQPHSTDSFLSDSALHIAAAIASAKTDDSETAAAVAVSSNNPMLSEGINAAEQKHDASQSTSATALPQSSVPNPLDSPNFEPPLKRTRFDGEPSVRDEGGDYR